MAHAHNIALSRPSRKLSFQTSAGALDAAKKTPRPQWLVRMARWLRYNEAALRLILSTFRALQRVGINVSPNHYYWPIPDIATLETRPWPTDTVPAGLDLALPRQLQLLQSLKTEFGSEWRFPHVSDGRGGYHYNNGFFETVDAEIAYSFVRKHKPRRIIEVGGGFSTRIMAAAMRVNQEREGAGGELITIDPDPERVSHPSVSLIVSPVQDVSLDLFLSLEAGDILFLDSSHVVGIGSDVVREYLEILPRLNPGVIVHMHDIFLPAEYPRASVVERPMFLVRTISVASVSGVQYQFRSAMGQQRDADIPRRRVEARVPTMVRKLQEYAASPTAVYTQQGWRTGLAIELLDQKK